MCTPVGFLGSVLLLLYQKMIILTNILLLFDNSCRQQFENYQHKFNLSNIIRYEFGWVVGFLGSGMLLEIACTYVPVFASVLTHLYIQTNEVPKWSYVTKRYCSKARTLENCSFSYNNTSGVWKASFSILPWWAAIDWKYAI